MPFLIQKLSQLLEIRKQNLLFRQPRLAAGTIDFCSNDYLGLARSIQLWQASHYLSNQITPRNGSTGSRLLTGHSQLYEELEKELATFYQGEAALLFNSGYDANLGLCSCLLQKGDTWLYDELCHASIRDGLRLSVAKHWSFRHNDLEDLEDKLQRAQGNKVVIVEAIYSMDGDKAPLLEIIELCKRYYADLVIDEAHATGIRGKHGNGLTNELNVAECCLARIYTFGKALGVHGAVVVGSKILKEYLCNFARSLIYTTSLPPHSLCAIRAAHQLLPTLETVRNQLSNIIAYFKKQIEAFSFLPFEFQIEEGPIAILYVPGNEKATKLALYLQKNFIDARAILSPTVPAGKERIRFCLHAYNTPIEIDLLFSLLKEQVGVIFD
ncbi:MAG: 8-amino-7-oxononanoate synthase [Bacteroidia bacterium]|nr:8-amino-7-oxononanoate synthase [Bacteroidia bacterium]MDW8158158.1 8-amino-7-oxononanoate synthase [Bacteroidia bacterium]